MRTVLTWLAIGGAILAAYFAQTFFNLSNTQIAFVYGMVGLMWLNYEINTLKESRPQLKKKFVKDLLYSKPKTVKHNPPKNLTPDGKERYGAEKYDFECFLLFWFFGEAVNGELQDSATRIQEINSTDLSLPPHSMDGPAYGRRYEIFYNQVKIGLLEIEANSGWPPNKWDKSVFAHIALDRVPVTALPHHAVRGFLGTIAGLVTSEKKPRGSTSEYEHASSTINYEVAETMWGVLHAYTLAEPFGGDDLAVHLSGTPDRYYHLEAYERAKRTGARVDQEQDRPTHWVSLGMRASPDVHRSA